MGVDIKIIKDRCKGCKICVEVCQAKVLDVAKEFNTLGYHPPCIVNLEACTNCGLCEMLCPDFAIFTHLVQEEVCQ
jgi:2-oxoglutarate ferredoxin oxidoreductase subunit delta